MTYGQTVTYVQNETHPIAWNVIVQLDAARALRGNPYIPDAQGPANSNNGSFRAVSTRTGMHAGMSAPVQDTTCSSTGRGRQLDGAYDRRARPVWAARLPGLPRLS
jgi:hypothetical protein